MAIKRRRWKAICFTGIEDNENETEWYGLKSLSSPIPVKELTPFENEINSLVEDIKFRKVRNHYQGQL